MHILETEAQMFAVFFIGFIVSVASEL
jgi:hypothetical protein